MWQRRGSREVWGTGEGRKGTWRCVSVGYHMVSDDILRDEARQDWNLFSVILLAGLCIFDESPRRDGALWIHSGHQLHSFSISVHRLSPVTLHSGSFVYFLLFCDLDFPEQF